MCVSYFFALLNRQVPPVTLNWHLGGRLDACLGAYSIIASLHNSQIDKDVGETRIKSSVHKPIFSATSIYLLIVRNNRVQEST